MKRVQTWQVWLADLGTPIGHEQRGQRPVIIVSSKFHLDLISAVVVVVPLTTRDRALPHHVRIASTDSGLDRPSWARSEDLHSISTQRLVAAAPFGRIDDVEREQLRKWMSRMVNLNRPET